MVKNDRYNPSVERTRFCWDAALQLCRALGTARRGNDRSCDKYTQCPPARIVERPRQHALSLQTRCHTTQATMSTQSEMRQELSRVPERASRTLMRMLSQNAGNCNTPAVHCEYRFEVGADCPGGRRRVRASLHKNTP